MVTMSRTPIRPGAGGIAAKAVAVLALGAAVAGAVAAAVTGPWGYTWRACGLLLLGALAGAALVWGFAVPRRQDSAPDGGALDRVVSRSPSTDGHSMAEALVELLDAVPSESLRYRISRALADGGVAEFGADGEVFDPGRHHVIEVEWTDDPARDSHVARTLRPGFSDEYGVVRAAEVLVYRSSRPTAGASGSTR